MTGPSHSTASARAKILMLIPNLGFGGAQRVFYDHSRLLAGRHSVTEVVFNLNEGHAFQSGNEVLSLDVPGGGGMFGKLAHFVKRIGRLTELKRKLGPELTISHLEGADYVNLLARGGDRRLLVIHGSKLHDANIRGTLGFIRKRLMIPLLYNRADLIVTVSREIGIELAAMGVRKDLLRAVPNFFDPAAIRQRSLEPLSAEEQSLFAGPPVIVTSGRLALQKNHKALVALFAQLLQRRPARLLLIGDGEMRQPLIDQATALGLSVGVGAGRSHDIHFLGFQENPFRLQRHADLFVLPSGWEGFPMVLGEAMACGLPIVSADCPTGPREFLAPDTICQAVRPQQFVERCEYGILMPIPAVGDHAMVEPWVETLDCLLGDPAELARMAAQSIVRAEAFSRDAIVAQWMELIDDLVGGPSAASV